jgi:methylated-DNA-[protein]-cysteine S-methyltransferase
MVGLSVERFESPVGDILLVSDGQALRALDFVSHEARMMALLGRYWGGVRLTAVTGRGARSAFRVAVERYLAGELDAIDKLPVNTGGTPFQQEVWRALRTIPVGTTWSYGQLAQRLGRPNGARAVGLANGANPVSVVVPCHRVIGAGGALTGYGGGLPRKRWLLAHEGCHIACPTGGGQEQALLWA